MVLLEDAKLDQPHLRLLCGRGLGDIGGAIFFCDNKARPCQGCQPFLHALCLCMADT